MTNTDPIEGAETATSPAPTKATKATKKAGTKARTKKVLLRANITGRCGIPGIGPRWPKAGTIIEVPAAEARRLIQSDAAVDPDNVDDED